MRILVATPWYAPEGGGLERYAHEVSRRLVARGHEVRALAFTRELPRVEARDGVVVERVRPAFVASNTPVRLRHPLALARRARDADLVVGHGPVPFSMESAAVAARLARRPFVATYHAGRLVGGTRALDAVAAANRATIERFAFATARRIVVVSPLVAAYVRRFAAKTVIVPPGVDAAFVREGTPEPGRVLFVGPLDRAYAWKGFGVLYEAFREVARARPEARLVAVGDGNERPAWIARATRDGLADRAHFPGRLDEALLAREYARASVAVLPSTSEAESFGMVLAEANAAGVPVVAARLPGGHGFVRDGENGLLVPPGDARALADALVGLLRDPDRGRALGARGRERVRREHAWEAVVDATERAYAAALGSRAARGSPAARIPNA